MRNLQTQSAVRERLVGLASCKHLRPSSKMPCFIAPGIHRSSLALSRRWRLAHRSPTSLRRQQP